MPAGTESIGPVVVGIDGSEASLFALVRAIHEAGWRGVPLHVVHVLNITPAVLHLAHDRTITTRELAETDREEVWRRAVPALERCEVSVVEVNREGDPGEILCDYAREIDASVLVVGPRGRGRLMDALLGSTAHTVVKDADCDVLVVKT